MDSDSQISSDFEESKEKRAKISKEIDVIVDDVKMLKLNESNAQVIRLLQNSNTHSGKCKIFYYSVILDAVSSLYAAY